MTGSAVFEGFGLHSGVRSRARVVRARGPVRLRIGALEATRDALTFDGDLRSTRASFRSGEAAVSTVEHLFAALGALSLQEGVIVEVEGTEIPLLDGGAATFLDAIGALGVEPSASPWAIVRRGVVEVGQSVYRFEPPLVDEVDVAVTVDFGDPRLEQEASWHGDREDFRRRIAEARTFGFAHEVGELLSRGLARHVDRASVVVVAPDAIHSAGRPFLADEPARHKLLDLVGDLYANGGPFRGRVRARRPGHGATHEALRRARAEGLVAPRPRATARGFTSV